MSPVLATGRFAPATWDGGSLSFSVAGDLVETPVELLDSRSLFNLGPAGGFPPNTTPRRLFPG